MLDSAVSSPLKASTADSLERSNPIPSPLLHHGRTNTGCHFGMRAPFLNGLPVTASTHPIHSPIIRILRVWVRLVSALLRRISCLLHPFSLSVRQTRTPPHTNGAFQRYPRFGQSSLTSRPWFANDKVMLDRTLSLSYSQSVVSGRQWTMWQVREGQGSSVWVSARQSMGVMFPRTPVPMKCGDLNPSRRVFGFEMGQGLRIIRIFQSGVVPVYFGLAIVLVAGSINRWTERLRRRSGEQNNG